MTSNLFLVLTGKTASGKDTVMRKILSRLSDFKKIVTTTARTPRNGEQNRADYNFISEADFRDKIAKGGFIEYVEYGGNLYGTEKAEIINNLNQNLIWRIDPSRAGKLSRFIKNSFEPDLAQDLLKRILVVYLTVDDRVVLKRLKQRGLNKKEIETRMREDAEYWNQYKDSYDFVVENVPGKLDQTVDKIVDIMIPLNQKGIIPIVLVVGITIISLVWLYASKPAQETSTSAKSNLASTIPLSTPAPTFTSTPLPAPASTPPVTSKPEPASTPATTNNTPPGAGYQHQVVNVEGQNFPVSIVAADLNSTKVIVDTASDSDCSDNCPVLALADYVGRNGAYAGINGSFFCPADYDSCKGKSNSFDTLLMNKNKHYFNSNNNVYSTVPAAIFSVGSARFVGRSLEWGRDTSVDSVIANYPLLVSGGNINFTENPAEPKFGQKGPRTFLATRQGMVYIGVVSNATMGESAQVLKALGMDEALNLDEGGSTALWYGGYKAGPGRNIPNAVLFVRR